MELHFRQRLDRPDKKGRAGIFADLHWAGGNRWKLPTGVKVLPAHWQPTKTRRIHTAADNSIALNLRLTQLLTAVQGVFTAAVGAGRPEASVTREELQAAVDAVGAGSQRRAKPVAVAPTMPSSGPVPATATWADFEARWLAENKQRLSTSYLRAARQVVDGLAGFDHSLRLASLTKERLAQYVAWLYAHGKRDSTVQRHYKFLRECYRLAELPQPRWLERFTARYGRSPTLRQAEVQALLLAPTWRRSATPSYSSYACYCATWTCAPCGPITSAPTTCPATALRLVPSCTSRKPVSQS